MLHANFGRKYQVHQYSTHQISHGVGVAASLGENRKMGRKFWGKLEINVWGLILWLFYVVFREYLAEILWRKTLKSENNCHGQGVLGLDWCRIFGQISRNFMIKFIQVSLFNNIIRVYYGLKSLIQFSRNAFHGQRCFPNLPELFLRNLL